MSGWFSVKRGITSHPLFKGHPERLAIWLWLLDNAVWKDTPHDIRGKMVTIRRAQVCAAERRIAEEVGVGRQVVRTALARFQAEHMINPDPTQGRTIITICNYEKYQTPQPKDNPEVNPPLTQEQPTKEQVNKIPPTEEPATPTLAQRLWGEGLAVLKRGGMTDKAARSYLGKLRKDHQDETVLAALMAADRAGSSDVAAYVAKTAKRKTHGADDYLASLGIRDLTGGGNDTGGNFKPHRREPSMAGRHGPDAMPGMQPRPAQEAGSVLEFEAVR